MKKSILNVALLSMLFVLGACSTEEDKGEDKAAALAAANVGLEDALTKVGAVTGFDKWSTSASDTIEGTTFAGVENLFISYATENYKKISADVINGTAQIDDEENTAMFNNEVTRKRAEKGLFIITTTPFSLVSMTLAGGKVPVTDLAGYTELYRLTPAEKQSWDSVKMGGTGAWVTEIRYSNYYIVKKTGTTLSMIEVTGDPTVDTSVKTYLILSTMEEAIAKANNYTK